MDSLWNVGFVFNPLLSPWHDRPRSAWPSGNPRHAHPVVCVQSVSFLWKNHAFTSFLISLLPRCGSQRLLYKAGWRAVTSVYSHHLACTALVFGSLVRKRCMYSLTKVILIWLDQLMKFLDYVDWCFGFKSYSEWKTFLFKTFHFVLGFPIISCLCLAAVIYLKMTEHGLSSLLTIRSVDRSCVLLGNCNWPKMESFRSKTVQTRANCIITGWCTIFGHTIITTAACVIRCWFQPQDV